MNTAFPYSIIIASTFVLSVTLCASSKEPWSPEDHVEVVTMESESGLLPFIESYVRAVNSRDLKAIKAMTHPKDLAATIKFLAHPPRDYKGETLKSMLLYDAPVPPDHTPFEVKKFMPGAEAPEQGLIKWVVPPTHSVEFSYEKPSRHFVWVTIYVARDGGRWFLVGGLPDAHIEENLRDQIRGS